MQLQKDISSAARGCTSIEELNQLICSSNRSNVEFRLSFFYNPPDDHQIYHITCVEFTSDFNDIDQHSDHTFYHRLDDKIICQVTCLLIRNTLIAQYLNKSMFGIEFKQTEEQEQECLTFSSTQRNNLEYHLRGMLISNKKPNINIWISH
jgi:hypothetical protein